jgi:hypothetical protein
MSVEYSSNSNKIESSEKFANNNKIDNYEITESDNYDNNEGKINLPLISKNEHPCSKITLSNSETTVTYQTSELYKIRDDINPITGMPFIPLLREKIELYYTCLDIFPDYSMYSWNNAELYDRWISSYKFESEYTEKEKEYLDIRARCFLEPEDLVDFYKCFDNSSLNVREDAINYLKETGKTWILRNSSLIDTTNSKGYALTILYKEKAYSFAIVHKLNEGYYYNVTLQRGDSTDKPFTFSRSYVTIIDLLKNVLGEQLKNSINTIK